jgi:flavin-dependent dehydrogenase
VVLDARALPLDKACGEGVMPAGVALLTAMGAAIPPTQRATFRGVRYVEGDLTAEGRFGASPGWGVRRTALISALVERATALGVDLRYGCAMRRWRLDAGDRVAVETDGGALDARLLVGADGLHSRIRRDAGLSKPWRGPRRLGLRLHFGVAPWTDCVEVHLAGDVEAYVTPVGSQEVGVALMWNGDDRRVDELLASFPILRERLDGAPVTSAPRGAGPFRQGVRRRYASGVALVGDAAGYLDPLTGEGITLGLQTATALVETWARGASLAEYERAYRALSANYYRMTSLLLVVAPRRVVRRRVIASLARHPDVFDRLLEVNDGRATLRDVGLGGFLRLASGLLRQSSSASSSSRVIASPPAAPSAASTSPRLCSWSASTRSSTVSVATRR